MGVTALWLAIKKRHQPIVTLLLRHGADINVFEKNSGNTCLMSLCLPCDRWCCYSNVSCTSCSRLSSAMIQNVLSHTDVNTNSRNNTLGATALHYAVANNNFGVVKLLIKIGAADTKIHDKKGLSPLMLAALSKHYSIVKLLFLIGDYSDDEKIVAYELMVIACIEVPAVYKRYYDTTDFTQMPRGELMENIRELLKIKQKYQGNDILFGYQTLLDSLCYDPDGHEVHPYDEPANDIVYAYTEFFINMLKRIFGQYHIILSGVLNLRAFELRNRMLYQQSLHKYLERVKVHEYNGKISNLDYIRLILTEGSLTDLRDIIEVIQYVVSVLKKNYAANPEMHRNFRFFSNMKNIVVFIQEVICLCVADNEFITLDIWNQFVSAVKTLIQINPKFRDGNFLLHTYMCCEDIPISKKTLQFFISLGTDIEALNERRETPLFCFLKHHSTHGPLVREITMVFINNGAHLDIRNEMRQTIFSLLDKEVRDEIQCMANHNLKLSCLASVVIKNHNLNYKGVIPKHLYQLVQIH